MTFRIPTLAAAEEWRARTAEDMWLHMLLLILQFASNIMLAKHNTTHKLCFSCTCSYFVCIKRNIETLVVEMIVRPPYEYSGLSALCTYVQYDIYIYIDLYSLCCVYIYIYTYVYIYIYLYICIHTRCVCVYVCMYVYIYMCTCVYIYIYIYIHMHEWRARTAEDTRLRMLLQYMYVYVCICIYIEREICIYTQYVYIYMICIIISIIIMQFASSEISKPIAARVLYRPSANQVEADHRPMSCT